MTHTINGADITENIVTPDAQPPADITNTTVEFYIAHPESGILERKVTVETPGTETTITDQWRVKNNTVERRIHVEPTIGDEVTIHATYPDLRTNGLEHRSTDDIIHDIQDRVEVPHNTEYADIAHDTHPQIEFNHGDNQQ